MLSTILVGSIIAWLRSHSTQRTEEVKFHLDQIYRPLYDELLKVIDDLNSCRVATLPKWREIDGSNLREWVSSEVAEAMRNLERNLEKYHEIWDQAYFVATNKVMPLAIWESLRRLDPSVQNPHPEYPLSKAVTEVIELVRQDYRFLFDRDYREDVRFLPRDGRGRHLGMGDKVTTLLGRVGYHRAPDVGYDILRHVRAALMAGGRPSERETAMQDLMPKVEAARKLVQHRLKRPVP